jgi:hypothetical protein
MDAEENGVTGDRQADLDDLKSRCIARRRKKE